jgi:hypothetical protein
MKKTLSIAAICLLTNACATDRQVVNKISALEQRRLAVEIALAERVTKVEGVAEVACPHRWDTHGKVGKDHRSSCSHWDWL